MFKNLGNFAYVRTGKEAVGFYIAYLIVVIVLGGALAALVGAAVNMNNTLNEGIIIGTIVAVLTVLTLSILLVRAKHAWNGKGIALIVVSGILAALGGGLLGLIPVAYLTTLPVAGGPVPHM